MDSGEYGQASIKGSDFGKTVFLTREEAEAALEAKKGEVLKPILFNTEMVRAILDGRKTVTRRVVKLKYSNTHLTLRTDKYGTRLIELQNEEPGVTTIKNPDGTTTHRLLAAMEKTPPYRPGDILYVRETWRAKEAGYPPYHCIIEYKAGGTEKFEEIIAIPTAKGEWKPSIHMPKEAARLFLRVTDVRVERLQDITEEQAAAEGAPKAFEYNTPEGPVITLDEDGYFVPGFKAVWNSTIPKNKLPVDGWDANPWVWVIEFERISKEKVQKGGEGNG